MTFGHDDVQAAEFIHALAEMNVGAAAGHVGGDGDAAALAGLRDDLGLVPILRGVEHGVRQPGGLQFRARALAMPQPSGSRSGPARRARAALATRATINFHFASSVATTTSGRWMRRTGFAVGIATTGSR